MLMSVTSSTVSPILLPFQTFNSPSLCGDEETTFRVGHVEVWAPTKVLEM